ncbi:HEAT repeat domain-containing protein [Aquamicrobium sp. NLF2-7]|uniref:HEAT repeat domain-containing protein n=1 Tax=Aquamicrobium sp. NLF2-7 TaxID=2918753 RepID=UPI001EFBFAC6|nr:HEAT repeat domain-containing protein [Aquamicrobium sp. NLF2-7]MCG8273869.1 HEAT repeat domain-containing protein [Aquamicrobium sp. NLF2-7]
MQVRMLLGVLAIMATAGAAAAQSVLDEIEASIDGRASELERVEKLLSDSDPKRRIAAMEAILKTGDPAFVRKAREVGLFSADPQLRQIAVKAIFDAGGPFRIDTAPPTKDSTNIIEFVVNHSGSVDANGGGTIQFVLTGDYSAEHRCWTNRRGNCSLRQTGDVIHLTDWTNGTGSFTLDDSGVLQGTLLYARHGKPVDARIPLYE